MKPYHKKQILSIARDNYGTGEDFLLSELVTLCHESGLSKLTTSDLSTVLAESEYKVIHTIENDAETADSIWWNAGEEKQPIQLNFLCMSRTSRKLPANRLKTPILKAQFLKYARERYKVGEEFLFPNLRKDFQEAGFHPEDGRQGFLHASSYLAKNGFRRLGEVRGKNPIASCGSRRPVLWKREK